MSETSFGESIRLAEGGLIEEGPVVARSRKKRRVTGHPSTTRESTLRDSENPWGEEEYGSKGGL